MDGHNAGIHLSSQILFDAHENLVNQLLILRDDQESPFGFEQDILMTNLGHGYGSLAAQPIPHAP